MWNNFSNFFSNLLKKYSKIMLTFILIIWFIVFGFLVIVSLRHWGASIDWMAVTGLATWVLAGGVGAAIWQISEARKSTNAQIAVDLFNELRNEDAIETLRYIYNLPSEDKLGCLLDSSKHRIDYLLDRFNLLGNLVKQGIVDEKLAIESYVGFPAVRVWYQLYDYIKKEDDDRGWYMGNFEPFARKCLDYFENNSITVNLTKGDPKKTIDVTNELINPIIRPRTWNEIEEKRKTLVPIKITPSLNKTLAEVFEDELNNVEKTLNKISNRNFRRQKLNTLKITQKTVNPPESLLRSTLRDRNNDKEISVIVWQSQGKLQHKIIP